MFFNQNLLKFCESLSKKIAFVSFFSFFFFFLNNLHCMIFTWVKNFIVNSQMTILLFLFGLDHKVSRRHSFTDEIFGTTQNVSTEFFCRTRVRKIEVFHPKSVFILRFLTNYLRITKNTFHFGSYWKMSFQPSR